MARNKLTPSSLLSFLEEGGTQKEAAAAFEVSLPKIQKMIAELQSSEEALNIYKGLQPLHLTHLQAEILSRVTSDKLDEADLDTLMRAFNVLKKVELQEAEVKQGEKITGLVSYLLELEAQEKREKLAVDITPDSSDMVSDTIQAIDKPKSLKDFVEGELLDALP